MSDSLEVVKTPWYEAEVLAFPEPDQDRIERKVGEFQRKGWSAATATQSVKHLRDGIHELRIVGTGAAYRILFFVVPGRTPRVVALTTCAAKSAMKKRQRMEAEIGRAKERRAAWLEQQRTQKGGPR